MLESSQWNREIGFIQSQSKDNVILCKNCKILLALGFQCWNLHRYCLSVHAWLQFADSSPVVLKYTLSSLFLGSAQPVSIYRNVCPSVCPYVRPYVRPCELEKKLKVYKILSKPLLRPGWRRVLQYKCTSAGGQFLCVSVIVYSIYQLGPS